MNHYAHPSERQRGVGHGGESTLGTTAHRKAPVPMTGGCDSSWRTQPLAVAPDKRVVGKAQRAMDYCDRHMRQPRSYFAATGPAMMVHVSLRRTHHE